eukprot:g21625.t1
MRLLPAPKGSAERDTWQLHVPPGWELPPSPSTGSQVPVLNAVEAEENSWSDPCLLNDRVDLSTTIVNLAEEFRRVSFGHHEASSPSTINCKREARSAAILQN